MWPGPRHLEQWAEKEGEEVGPRKASIFRFKFEPLTLKGVGASRWTEEFEFKLPCLEPTRENAEVLTPLLHT